jgi:hypothetical protein
LRFSFVCLPYFSPFSLLRTCTVQACQFDSYRAVQTHFFCFSPFVFLSFLKHYLD